MIQKLLRSAGLRQSVVLSGGNLFAAFFSAAALILISRQLAPVLFGEFTVGYSLMIILVRIQGIGMTAAIQKIAGKYFHEKAWEVKLSHLLQVATRYSLLVSAVFLVLGFFLAWPLAALLHVSSPLIFVGSFVFAAVTVVFEYVANILQVVHRFMQSVLMMVLQSVLKLVVALVIFFSHVHSAVLSFYSFYLTPVFGTVLGLYFLPKGVKLVPLVQDQVLAKQIWKTVKHTSILLATAGIIDYIDVLFVKRYTSSFDTGIYGGISQLASAVSLIAYSIAAVLNARVARYHDKQNIDSYLKKSLVIVLVAAAGLLTYIPLAKLSITLTIGHAYLPGLPYITILMISSFLLMATVPYIALFYSFESSLYFSVSSIGQLLIMLIGGNFIIAHFGITGAVWLKVFNKVFLLLITIVWAMYEYRKKFARRQQASVAV